MTNVNNAENKSPYAVLITGAGAPDIVSTIDNLRQNGIKVVAVDSDPLSVGLFKADKGYTIPLASNRSFIECLLNLVR